MAGPEVAIERAGPAHLDELAVRMRPADAAEIRAATGEDDLRCILADSLAASREAWAVTFDGDLVCVWGVVPLTESVLGGRVGWVWMATTDAVDRWRKAFWVASKRLLAHDAFRLWDELRAAVAADYAAALRWARRLGFEVGPAEPAGTAGALFHPCVKRRAS